MKYLILTLMTLSAQAQDIACKRPDYYLPMPSRDTAVSKAERERIEDTFLALEIEELQARYPAAWGANHKDLEKRVLAHAIKHKIKSFCEAFKQVTKL